MFFNAVLRPLLELLKVPARLGNANDRTGQLSFFRQLLQSGENLLVSEIAGSAKTPQRRNTVALSLLRP
jgi:hypothetical protein